MKKSVRPGRKSLMESVEKHSLDMKDENYVLVEIGVCKGETMVEFCQLDCVDHYIGIDPWKHYENPPDKTFQHGFLDQHFMDNWDQDYFDKQYENCQKLLSQLDKKAALIRNFSHLAVNLVLDESVNFVFVDGSHQKEYVLKDIELWYPKLKPGGAMVFDDWHQMSAERNGTIDDGPGQAIQDFAAKNALPVYFTECKNYACLMKNNKKLLWRPHWD
jgi:hypothetical protein